MKLVIFDVDGTLVDSQAHIQAAMAQSFASVGLAAPTRADILDSVGLSLPSVMARLAPQADAQQVGRMVDAYREALAEMRAAGDVSPLYPGAREVLARLHARDEVLLGIATGKSRHGLRLVLEGLDLGGLFQTVQCADDHPSKPHPSMIHAALAETGAEASETVFVGDTTFDMEMGRAAGVTPLGVAWGYHREPALAAAGALRVVDSFAALDDALVKLGAGEDG